MKFSAVILSVLAAVAIASPVAEPVANPIPAAEYNKLLEKRLCVNGWSVICYGHNTCVRSKC
ncbi:hypothetical protein AJ80_06751 [Polytolypa hystricis UAMH7299]|uniref:Uncharacterized protein n=1 Tax=Polytolypa hystricis (strain UAMH7299) TaxID=1447883 RepID=A0A2B7XUA1_POLH7|nr:hypothetical protein AJ80_06751 [Polytolypa hystricis UAMH7299]